GEARVDKAVVFCQLARMSGYASALEISRGGTHPLVEGTDRLINDPSKGIGVTADRNIEALLDGVELCADARYDIEAHPRVLPLKSRESFSHESDHHRGRHPDADVSLDLLRCITHDRQQFVVVVDQPARGSQVTNTELRQRDLPRAA